MELNGVANIHLIVQAAKQDGSIAFCVAEDIKKQLDLLERYMIAMDEHAKSIQAGAYGARIVGKELPWWHEVRENPDLFPNSNERFKGWMKKFETEDGP